MSRFSFVGVLALSLSLAGCVETAGPSAGNAGNTVGRATAVSTQKTAAEVRLEKEARSLNQQTTSIIVRNTVEGAIVGAAIGCGLGLLIGGGGEDCARGAVAGGVLGGVAGNQVGQQAAQKNAQLVNRDKVLANLSGVSTKLNSVETNLRSVVASQNAEIASLNRQLSGGQISKSAYNSRIKSINANRQAVSASLASTEKNIVKARGEIRTASSKGQKGLSDVDKAAVSTQNRLARNRKLLTIVS